MVPNKTHPTMNITLRLATEADASGVLAIYAPFIRDTAVSFETEVPPLSDIQNRIKTVLSETPWLLAIQNEQVIGYAYAGLHRSRHAYRYTREVSVYLAPEAKGKGVAKCLYTALLDILILQGFCTALAGATLPNPASVRFHQKMGFRHLGTFHRVGYKNGKFHDVIWLERPLRDTPPEQLRLLPEIPQEEIDPILKRAGEAPG